MSLLPKGGADMCTRCGCQDREICELCGGNDTAWSTSNVQLDADHQGELTVKLMDVIKDKNTEILMVLKVMDTKGFDTQALQEASGLFAECVDLIGIITRITENKATNADLEYIDCL